MNRLPVPRPDRPQSSRELVQAAKAQRQTELAIFEHSMQARYDAECERIDAQAVSDVVRTALDEELALLEWGMERAAGSAAKAELVSRKVSMQTEINNRRIARRFGM